MCPIRTATSPGRLQYFLKATATASMGGNHAIKSYGNRRQEGRYMTMIRQCHSRAGTTPSPEQVDDGCAHVLGDILRPHCHHRRPENADAHFEHAKGQQLNDASTCDACIYRAQTIFQEHSSCHAVRQTFGRGNQQADNCSDNIADTHATLEVALL